MPPTSGELVDGVWDADVAAIIDRLAQLEPATMAQRGVSAVRASLESITRPLGPQMAAVTEMSAPGPHGPVPVRIYRPMVRAEDSTAPSLVWFHGGGMIMGSLDSFDRLARDLAEATGAVIVNVDYRLAPEYRYPVGNDDAYAALEWAVDQAESLGLDTSSMGVGGDSAGGGLAASTALRARNTGGPALAQQVMFYPGLERPVPERPSMQAHGDGPFLTIADITWMKNLYLGDDPSRDDEYGTPALATELAGLPPAILATGLADPLYDGIEEYGARLAAASVPTAVLRYPGLGHGFAMQAPGVARARAAIAEVGVLVAARFAGRS